MDIAPMIPLFQIVEFRPEFNNQVIDLVDRLLKDLTVIPDTHERITDADLMGIPIF
jgi:hypothetical protein